MENHVCICCVIVAARVLVYDPAVGPSICNAQRHQWPRVSFVVLVKLMPIEYICYITLFHNTHSHVTFFRGKDFVFTFFVLSPIFGVLSTHTHAKPHQPSSSMRVIYLWKNGENLHFPFLSINSAPFRLPYHFSETCVTFVFHLRTLASQIVPPSFRRLLFKVTWLKHSPRGTGDVCRHLSFLFSSLFILPPPLPPPYPPFPPSPTPPPSPPPPTSNLLYKFPIWMNYTRLQSLVFYTFLA